MTKSMTRRAVLGQAAGGAAFLSATAASLSEAPCGRRSRRRPQLQGRVRQSVCQWSIRKSVSRTCAARARRWALVHRVARGEGLRHAEEARPRVRDGQRRSRRDRRPGLNRLDHDKIVAFFRTRRRKWRQRGSGTSSAFRQPRRDARRARTRPVRDRPQAHHADCEKYKVLAVIGTAQQQGQPPRLHVRPHRLGRRIVQEGRFGALQAALRHLPHADHGRRRDRDDSEVPSLLRALPHRRRSPGTRSTRRRRSLPGDDEGDRRDRLQGLRRAGVHSGAGRCAGFAEQGVTIFDV